MKQSWIHLAVLFVFGGRNVLDLFGAQIASSVPFCIIYLLPSS